MVTSMKAAVYVALGRLVDTEQSFKTAYCLQQQGDK
jgi:hypothetical protein